MFTGIIEATGTVAALDQARGRGAPRRRRPTSTSAALPLGASIAVDGVCLTVVERGRRALRRRPRARDARAHDARRAPARRARPPRAAAAPRRRARRATSSRATSTASARSWAAAPSATSLELEIAAPATVVATLVPKGSITVAGASLTINDVTDDRFSVTLIPHTLAVTTLGALASAPPSTSRAISSPSTSIGS